MIFQQINFQLIIYNSIKDYLTRRQIKMFQTDCKEISLEEHNTLHLKIEQICQQSLGFFVEKLPLTRSNFPIMEMTFTLWRTYAYNKVEHLGVQKSRIKQANWMFYTICEKKYLPIFLKRVQSQMSIYSRGLESVEENLKQIEKLPKKQQQIYESIVQLGKSVWLQQLYLEMIEDLIHLPYLQVIPAKSSVIPKPEFMTDFIFRRQKESKMMKIANNTGKSIFNKLLAVVTETIFSKTMIIKINTLFGTFNPLVLGASFGLNRYLEHLDRKRKDEELEVQLKKALQFAQQKVAFIKDIYQKSLSVIEKILMSYGEQDENLLKKSLKLLYEMIFQEQWLQIEVKLEPDGWQSVDFQQKQSFQELSL